ncbi:hypothetical protein [Streptomyces sp. LN785]|uniref:hypothetical protein n=1 Tax=Streptomyces sp. LN785 TaxID=3112983 RepID=UPI003724070F
MTLTACRAGDTGENNAGKGAGGVRLIVPAPGGIGLLDPESSGRFASDMGRVQPRRVKRVQDPDHSRANGRETLAILTD